MEVVDKVVEAQVVVTAGEVTEAVAMVVVTEVVH